MSRNDRVQQGVVPILDFLQTMPSFVYLIPFLMIFGPAPETPAFAVILYAIPPVIRLTDLGIRLVDKEVLEASEAFGASPWQKLKGVQIPLAIPTISAGINQTIMMSLAMVVIASIVNAPGLGRLVLQGVNNAWVGPGLTGGLGIVVLAIILDRITRGTVQKRSAATQQD
jgi:glycine betaine/proline transport system permease protein